MLQIWSESEFEALPRKALAKESAAARAAQERFEWLARRINEDRQRLRSNEHTRDKESDATGTHGRKDDTPFNSVPYVLMCFKSTLSVLRHMFDNHTLRSAVFRTLQYVPRMRNQGVRPLRTEILESLIVLLKDCRLHNRLKYHTAI